MPRLAIAQLRPSKGDYGANLQKIGGVLAQVAKLDPPVDVVVFPEAAHLRLLSSKAASGRGRGPRGRCFAISPSSTRPREPHHRRRHRVLRSLPEPLLQFRGLYASLGGKDAGVRHVHRKVFLPTYGVFDEERFVDRGREIRAFDTRWGRAAILICEDAWHSLSGTIAALQGHSS